jgi:hypothetical protein
MKREERTLQILAIAMLLYEKDNPQGDFFDGMGKRAWVRVVSQPKRMAA